MKKLSLCSIAAAALAASLAQAQSAGSTESTPTSTDVMLYGRLDISSDWVRGGNPSYHELGDNGSRIGIRGGEKLGSELSAVFGFEHGFHAARGESASPAYRHAYVGLRHVSLGTLAIGRLDSETPVGSPVYSMNARIIGFLAHDEGVVEIGNQVLNARNRVPNAVGYASPALQGFTFRGRVALAGPNHEDPYHMPRGRHEDDHRMYDLSVAYEQGPLFAGMAYARDTRAGWQAANSFQRKWQLIAGYQAGPGRIYGLYGRDQYRNRPEARSEVPFWLVGATCEIGAHRFTLNVMERAMQEDRSGTVRRRQVGYGYALGPRTLPYLFYDAAHSRSDGIPRGYTRTRRSVGVGLQQKF